MKAHIEKNKIENVAILSLTSEDGYAGLGSQFALRAFSSTVIADAFEDLYYTLKINAIDPDRALETLAQVWKRLEDRIASGETDLPRIVREETGPLKSIEKLRPLESIPTILMVGEIYVRKEALSRRWLPEKLLEAGILTHTAPLHEWVMYIDWLVQKRLLNPESSQLTWLKHRLKQWVIRRNERSLKTALAETGWYVPRFVDIDHVIEAASKFISPALTGEAVLTTGGPLSEVGREFCGAIAIGPFGCMPNRLSESILNQKMERRWIADQHLDAETREILGQIPTLPFLAIESDGNPFPQLIRARLETFVVQAKRMHTTMLEVKGIDNPATHVSPVRRAELDHMLEPDPDMIPVEENA
jgi:predicted nucleotide-binding protein (sugar kinase/HSP70/actin superfamily)